MGRISKKLNQAEFAKLMSVSPVAVSSWETDKYYPDLEKFLKICKILGIKDEIFNFIKTEDEAETEEKEEVLF